MEKSKQRHCLHCHDVIKGRSDKRFCEDDCRTAYHNLLNKDTSRFMTNINTILRKNRRILAQFNTREKAKVNKSQLIEEGFKFSYHTNEFRTQAGKTYYFCYEQGYLELEEGLFALVVKHEYVE